MQNLRKLLQIFNGASLKARGAPAWGPCGCGFRGSPFPVPLLAFLGPLLAAWPVGAVVGWGFLV